MRLPEAQLVLDTNVLLHWLRAKATGEWLRREYALDARRPRPIVPVVVKGEMRALGLRLNWGEARLAKLDDIFRELIEIDISSDPVVEAYAEVDVWSLRQGRKMGKNDLWIAAVAKVLDGTILTTDGDFTHLSPEVVRVEQVVIPASSAQ